MSDETQKEANTQASSVPHAPATDVKPAVTPEATNLANGPRASRGHVESRHLMLALVIVLVGALSFALHLQSFFEDPKFRGVLISSGLHKRVRSMLPHTTVDATGLVDVSLAALLGFTTMAALALWLVGGTLLAVVLRSSWREALWRWGLKFLWFCLFGLFEVLWDTAGFFAGIRLEKWLTLLLACLPWVYTLAWGGWVAGGLGLLSGSGRTLRLCQAMSHPMVAWVACAIYVATFATLSILQYRALMVPHGDSAMYEEHLWNLLHGKGFRSQLDGGRLFFGEHLELIHMLLIPVYVLLPTLPTLNVCLSLGLASGAIAVRGITRRLTASDGAANWLAVAYLLYFPLQYLNLEVSLKTFRPENFGVPLLLFAIWALEAARYRTMLVLLSLVLVCKEDYAVPVGMLGLFLMVRRNLEKPARGARWLGFSLFASAALYLVFVLTIFIPTFRDGSPPHYMTYFPNLGTTPWEIARNILENPGLLTKPLVTGGNFLFLLTLLAPLGFLPILGLGRLWLCLPTLTSILLIQLDDARTPYFHFHAPLVPLVIWSAAEGLARVGNTWNGLMSRLPGKNSEPCDSPEGPCPFVTNGARYAAGCALVSGMLIGKSPLSIAFYDPDAGPRAFNKLLYFPDGIVTWHLRNLGNMYPMVEEMAAYLDTIGRVRSFERLFQLIPPDASVAASDYIRPRFTHHRMCHQYGEGGLKPHVNPDSIDYIVIDLLGPYSDWRLGQRPREIEESPDRWEVMHWDPEGELFFHVLRAKRSDR